MNTTPAHLIHLTRWRFMLLGMVMALLPALASAWELSGRKNVVAHPQGGQPGIVIGTVQFTPRPDGAVAFALTMDPAQLTDHFLSMKEFKCLESQGAPTEITCHVPYPYAHPGTVRKDDLRWLEHSLMFLFKQPRDFGAKLWNGLYYRMRLTEQGIVGTPQAIDLNLISAPPDRPNEPPYRPALRDDVPEGARWLARITIE